MTALPGAWPAAAGEPLRTTLRRLAAAQKGASGAPAYSRFVNRPAGRLLAAVAFRLGLTPNAVTAVSAMCTFAGIGLLPALPPSWPLGIGVASLLVLGYALDSADGQVARLRGGGSPAGEWLDHMADAVKVVAIHLGLLVGLYRFGGVPRGPLLLIPIAFAVVATFHFSATLLNEQLRRNHGAPERADPSAVRPPVARSLLALPTDYGVLALSTVLLGAPHLFVGVYAALLLGTAGYLALASGRWFREMARLPS